MRLSHALSLQSAVAEGAPPPETLIPFFRSTARWCGIRRRYGSVHTHHLPLFLGLRHGCRQGGGRDGLTDHRLHRCSAHISLCSVLTMADGWKRYLFVRTAVLGIALLADARLV